jgi:hypothetical protein
MQIRQHMEVGAAQAGGDISKLEADVIAALVVQHAAQGYSVIDFKVDREPNCDMITATLVMARGKVTVEGP